MEFSDTILRLGGFHVALSLMSVIGKKYHSSGLDDLLIESGVYGTGTTTASISGRSYNLGVRAHKLCFETFFRFIWKAFLRRNRKTTEAGNNPLNQFLQSKLKFCREKIDAKAGAGPLEDFESLQEGSNHTDERVQRRATSIIQAVWFLGLLWDHG